MPVLTTPTHTPGPWAWRDGDDLRTQHDRVAPYQYGSCVLFLGLDDDGDLEIVCTDADRALIAAAPALFTVLERAETMLAAVPPPTYVEGQPVPRLQGEPVAELEQLRLAVACARQALSR